MKKLLLALALVLMPVLPAGAGELALGLGRDDIRRGLFPALSGFLEIRSAPRWRLRDADFGYAAAIEADRDRDIWAGAGVFAALPLGRGLRLVPTAMIGVYRQGDGNDLGQTFPVFRTSIGLDLALGAAWRAGLVLGHKSNAFTGRINPGVESLHLTIGRRF
jgi:hypothetical protein